MKKTQSVVCELPTYNVVMGDDGTLLQIASDGSERELETAFVPVSESSVFIGAEAKATDDKWVFPVQVISAGFGKGTLNGEASVPHYYTAETVAQVAEAMKSAKFGRRHPKPGTMGEDDPDRIAGWYENGRVVSEAAVADLHLLKNETDLQTRLQSAREAGKLDLFGLSVFGVFKFRTGTVDGKKALVSSGLAKLVSVDLCAEAGAGGKFLVAASAKTLSEISALQEGAIKKSSAGTAATQAGSASDGESRKNGGAMRERFLKVLEALRSKNAGRADELKKKIEGAKDEQLPEIFAEVAEAASAEAAKVTTNNSETAELTKLVKEAKDAAAAVAKVQRANEVEVKVREAKLSKPAEKLVRKHLSEMPEATDAQVESEIKEVREAFAAFENAGRVTAGMNVTLDTNDKMQGAFDAMFGVKEAAAKPEFRGLKSLRKGYALVTGDSEVTGQVREAATATTATFPNLLLNSMTKRLIQDYNEIGMEGLDQLLSMVDIADYKSQDRVRLGYLGDIADVAEDAAYVAFAAPTDERINYSAGKRGNIFSVTRETILNDDLGKISVIPTRIARAARRTLKQKVTNLFVTNPNYVPDGVAWFAGGHSNLGANPLTIDELVAREIALGLQTEKDSNKPLGLDLEWLMVPRNLKATAWKINAAQFYNPGPAINVPNPFYLRFGPAQNPDKIIVNSLLDASDTNDWYCGALPDEAVIVEVGFVQGNREPQIFLQNDPQVGNVFSNDEITYKVRHEYGYVIMDFRGVQKNVVP